MPTPDLHELFLAHLPRFQAHTAFAFSGTRCPDSRADFEAETIALAWKHFIALARRGRRPELFVTTLALRCSQGVKAGRRLVRSESVRDVMSTTARARHGVSVEHLDGIEATGTALSDSLAVDTRTPVPRQVAFRLDFPAWVQTFRGQKRRILLALAAGERTTDVAARFGLSAGRVAQLRSEFLDSWLDFHASRQAPC